MRLTQKMCLINRIEMKIKSLNFKWITFSNTQQTFYYPKQAVGKIGETFVTYLQL